MKKLIFVFVAIFAIYCFVVNSDVRSGVTNEVENLSEKVEGISEVSGGGTSDVQSNSNYTQEEKEYFNEIVLDREYESSDQGVVCKWTSDMNIFVVGQKPEYLMNELDKIVGELNDIIDPININIVNNRSDANYVILFGSENEYNTMAPNSVNYTEDNWGMFIINSGERIFRGTMYVDIYRCESIDGQKHLLREELTQSLGLTNDSYKYDNSIFQQRWTETTEYAPIDIKLIEMLYNN
jgi:hypothetical protein